MKAHFGEKKPFGAFGEKCDLFNLVGFELEEGVFNGAEIQADIIHLSVEIPTGAINGKDECVTHYLEAGELGIRSHSLDPPMDLRLGYGKEGMILPMDLHLGMWGKRAAIPPVDLHLGF